MDYFLRSITLFAISSFLLVVGYYATFKPEKFKAYRIAKDPSGAIKRASETKSYTLLSKFGGLIFLLIGICLFILCMVCTFAPHLIPIRKIK